MISQSGVALTLVVDQSDENRNGAIQVTLLASTAAGHQVTQQVNTAADHLADHLVGHLGLLSRGWKHLK